MLDSQSYRIITLYSADQAFEPHPLQFHYQTGAKDAQSFIIETIENLKNHMNKPNLKAWDRNNGNLINFGTDDIYKYDAVVLSEQPPIVLSSNTTTPTQHKNVNNTAPVINEDQTIGTPVTSSSKKSQGPIVSVVVPRNTNLMEASVDNYKENLKSSVRLEMENKLNVGTKTNVGSINEVDTQQVQQGPTTSNVVGVLQERPANQSIQNIQNTKNTNITQSEPIHTTPASNKTSTEVVQPTQVKKSTMPPTGHIGTKSIEGDDPNIYSLKTSVMPFSYMFGLGDSAYNEKMPPPTYLPFSTLSDKKPPTKDNVFYGLQILPSGELKIVDPEILKNQKGIVKDALHSLIKSIAEGRGVVGVSLPIRIFEPRSLIERMCDFWMFAPKFLTAAAQSTDPIERLKYVTAFYIGGMHLGASQVKPFNPLLGETYQAHFPDAGIAVDLEHTSHHPPIATYLLTHKDFRMSGSYEFIGKLEGMTKNMLLMIQEGTTTIVFKDGHKITATIPYVTMEGLMHGDRTATFSGILKIVDEKNNLKVVVKMGDIGEKKAYPKKRTDAFYGKLYRYKELEGKQKKKIDDYKFEDLDSKICDVYGSWLECLKFDEDEKWNLDRDMPSQYYPIENPLPSDARFREDLIWVKRNNKKIAQEWKLKLEIRQRAEKKLRQDGYKLLPENIQAAMKSKKH